MENSNINQKFLVVDGGFNPDFRSIVAQLRQAGCAARIARSEDQTVELLSRDQQFKVVILDARGGNHAEQWIARIKSIRSDIIIVDCSSNDWRHTIATSEHSRCLLKPRRLAELIRQLQLVDPSGSPRDTNRDSRRKASRKKATLSSSDTRLSKGKSDTLCLRFLPNQRVRVAAGAMQGLEGTIAGNRSDGRILVRIEDGAFVEIHQYLLESIDGSQNGHDATDGRTDRVARANQAISVRASQHAPRKADASTSAARVHTRSHGLRKTKRDIPTRPLSSALGSVRLPTRVGAAATIAITTIALMLLFRAGDSSESKPEGPSLDREPFTRTAAEPSIFAFSDSPRDDRQ